MDADSLNSPIVATLAGVEITATVVTTWGVMLALAGLCVLATHRLGQRQGLLQTLAEAIVCTMLDAIREAAPLQAERLLPLIGSLWLFLVVANLTGLIPGLHSPTRDLAATSALAIVVFLSVHVYGIRDQGWRNYLRHYLQPSPILLPFHLISEITRTLALAIRLFGNIMSLETAALLVLMVAGFLAPVPLLLLHVIEALVQAYIFGMLALIYVAGALHQQQERANATAPGDDRPTS